MPRLISTFALTMALIAACHAGPASTPPSATAPLVPTPVPRPASAAGAPLPSAAGSLQVSGGVSGFLSVLAVNCSAPGQPVLVTIKGRIENKLFDVEVSAPGAGGFQIGGSAASIQMSSQTPDASSVSRWSATRSQSGTSGSVSIGSDESGSVDADLQGVAGTGGTVHLRGGWSCPAT